jgi:hypothetical protein
MKKPPGEGRLVGTIAGSAYGGHGEGGDYVGAGAADVAEGHGQDVAHAVVGAAGHDRWGGGDRATSSHHDVGGGALAGADAGGGAGGDQRDGGVGGGGQARASGGDRQGGDGVALRVELVGAVAGQGEAHLGHVAGDDVLGEVADLGQAGVDFRVVARGVGDGGFAVPLQQGAGGGVDGSFLEDLVAGVGDVQVHRAGDAVALARDEVGLEALLGVVVNDGGAFAGALDGGVVQRQDAGHPSGGRRDGASRGAQLHVELVAQGCEKTASCHGYKISRSVTLVCP